MVSLLDDTDIKSCPRFKRLDFLVILIGGCMGHGGYTRYYTGPLPEIGFLINDAQYYY